jgi:hypothetical protein
MDPRLLVGHRVQEVLVACHWGGGQGASDPSEVWLVDGDGGHFRLTTGSDWCLIVDDTAPHAVYGVGESGRVEVTASARETPFARSVGETVVAVHERFGAVTGRAGLEIVFATGTVRCASWRGELRLTG